MNQYIESAQRIFPKFEYYRNNYGGKAAGLKLLEQILKNDDFFYSYNYSQLPSKFLSFKLYNYYKVYGFNHSSIKRISLPNNTVNSKNKFHFRSSSTLEDWINPSLFGTFETVSEEIHSSNDFQTPLSNLFSDFKYFQEEGFVLPQDSLGIVIMPSLCDSYKFRKISLQVETFNDGFEDVVRVESSQQGFMEDQVDLGQLIDYRNKEKISISQLSSNYYSNLCKDCFNFNNSFEIGEKRSNITKKTLEELVYLSKFCKEMLGFEVSMEYILLQDRRSAICNYLFPVQLRPSRYQSKCTPLSTSNNEILFGNTSCVYNQFDMELPLLFRERYKYSDDFGENNYFSLHRDGRQYNRLRGDENKFSQIRGVIGVDSGFALNHDTRLLPHTFYGRDEFRYLGMPHIGELIQGFLTAQIGIHKSLISEVPFRMQSNGRYGQISLQKKYLETLTYAQESEKIRKLNYLIQELKINEEIPF